MPKRTFSYFFLTLIFAVNAYAAPLRFVSETKLDGIGIILPVFAGARENPPKPVMLTRWILSDGRSTWTEERASVAELWIEAQLVASWLHPNGHSMVMAQMTKLPPYSLGEQATREMFEKELYDFRYDVQEDSSYSMLAEWMATFCGADIIRAPELVPVNRSRLAKVLFFETADPALYAFAFRLNPSYPGQATASREWFAVILRIADERDDPSYKTVVNDLFGKIKSTGMFDGTRAVSAKKNRSRNVNRPIHEDAARLRARRSIKYLSTWWYMDSPCYIMLSNNNTAEKFAGEILEELEMMRPYYEMAAPKFGSSDDTVSVIRLFNDDEGYLTYLGNDFNMMDPNMTGGIFSSARRELVIRPISSSMKATREGSIRGVIKHEGFHQYLFMATGGLSASAWLNEGFACLFENCELDRYGNIEVMESRRHADILTDMIKRGRYDWKELLISHLQLDYDEFYANSKINYSIAWGLVYYLVRGAPEERGKPYAHVLDNYFNELARTGKAVDATAGAFSGINMKKFSDDFTSFWTTTKKRQDAKRRKGF